MFKLSEKTRGFLARWLFSPLQGITFGNWWRALVQNKFLISPRFWPRAFLTTITSLKNSLDARKEIKRYGKLIEKVSVCRPIFILGHYRSGTTHLHNLFAIDPRFAFPNYLEVTHPQTFLVSGAEIQSLGSMLSPERRPYDNVKLGLEVPAEEELALCSESLLSTHMCWHFPERSDYYERYLTFAEASDEERRCWQKHLLGFAKKQNYQYPDRQIVFKSPCHTARIGLILEVFPDALFVNIHRDPYDVFSSTRHMEIKTRPMFAYQNFDLSQLNDFILRRYRKMYEAYFGEKEKIPEGQFCEISFSDLEKQPVETMKKIYDALQLPNYPLVRPKVEAYISSLKNYQKNAYQELPSEIKNRVDAEWGFCFKSWGYPMAG